MLSFYLILLLIHLTFSYINHLIVNFVCDKRKIKFSIDQFALSRGRQNLETFHLTNVHIYVYVYVSVLLYTCAQRLLGVYRGRLL